MPTGTRIKYLTVLLPVLREFGELRDVRDAARVFWLASFVD